MMYIKVDADGNPEGFPISYDNVRYLVPGVVPEGEIIPPDALTELNLKLIEGYHSPSENVDIDGYDLTRGEIVKLDDGTIKQQWNITAISLKEKIRRWVSPPRGSYLIRSDWTQLADAPLTPEEKAAWAVYRAKLRSITDDIDFNTINSRNDFEWPEMPGPLDTVDSKWSNTAEDPPQP